MKIKILDNMSPRTQIWDAENDRVLFRFVDGEFETEDERIIKYWSKHYLGDVVEAEIVPKVDEKQALEDQIKSEFGIDIDRRWSLKKIKAKLKELREG